MITLEIIITPWHQLVVLCCCIVSSALLLSPDRGALTWLAGHITWLSVCLSHPSPSICYVIWLFLMRVHQCSGLRFPRRSWLPLRWRAPKKHHARPSYRDVGQNMLRPESANMERRSFLSAVHHIDWKTPGRRAVIKLNAAKNHGSVFSRSQFEVGSFQHRKQSVVPSSPAVREAVHLLHVFYSPFFVLGTLFYFRK